MRQTLKFAAAFLFTLLVRLIPFRPANVEPIMSTMLPFATRFNGLINAGMTMLGMIVYDLLTNYGAWTWYTAATYGAIALVAPTYFKRFGVNRTQYVTFAAGATIVYDAITGPIIPTLFAHGHFWALTVAQVPFTISHLVGNMLLAAVLSPLIQKYIVDNPAWEIPQLELALTKKPAA